MRSKERVWGSLPSWELTESRERLLMWGNSKREPPRAPKQTSTILAMEGHLDPTGPGPGPDIQSCLNIAQRHCSREETNTKSHMHLNLEQPQQVPFWELRYWDSTDMALAPELLQGGRQESRCSHALWEGLLPFCVLLLRQMWVDASPHNFFSACLGGTLWSQAQSGILRV